MEALLTHSFDYLSSYEPNKIRKGLRQVEGLLAQICLSRSKQTAAEKRRSMIPLGQAPPAPKALNELADDPAFREFFKLQEGFQWNGKPLTYGPGFLSERLTDRTQSPYAWSPVWNICSVAEVTAQTIFSSYQPWT
jgi:hypothetical protein